eukprot:sb/3473865/
MQCLYICIVYLHYVHTKCKLRFKRLDLRFLEIGAFLRVVFTKRDPEFPGISGLIRSSRLKRTLKCVKSFETHFIVRNMHVHFARAKKKRALSDIALSMSLWRSLVQFPVKPSIFRYPFLFNSCSELIIQNLSLTEFCPCMCEIPH